jgi:hypothetical protein
MFFCTKFKYVGAFLVPEFSDMADIPINGSARRKMATKGMDDFAKDRSAWGQRVESHLDPPPWSFSNLRRH